MAAIVQQEGMFMRTALTTVLLILMSVAFVDAQSEESETVTLEMLMSEIQELKQQQQNQRHYQHE